jgi:hypothetical protein
LIDSGRFVGLTAGAGGGAEVSVGWEDGALCGAGWRAVAVGLLTASRLSRSTAQNLPRGVIERLLNDLCFAAAGGETDESGQFLGEGRLVASAMVVSDRGRRLLTGKDEFLLGEGGVGRKPGLLPGT